MLQEAILLLSNVTRRSTSGIVKRRSPLYLSICGYLQEHPPTKEAFTIEELAENIGKPEIYVYQMLKKYDNDSILFMTDLFLSNGADERAWNVAIEELHNNGFYRIQPITPYNKVWKEPSYSNDEEYMLHNAVMHVKNFAKRVEYGRIFGHQLGQLNKGRAIEQMGYIQKSLENLLEDKQ